jgi:integrase
MEGSLIMRKWTQVPRHPNVYEYDTRRGKRFGIRRGFQNSVGKNDEFTKSGFLTWRDADVVLKNFEASLATGQVSPITHRGVTLGQYFDQMVERKTALGRWRKNTVLQNNHYFNKHLRPVYGNTPMAEISRAGYQRLIDQKVEDGYAKLTIRTIDQVMQNVMNTAEMNDIIDKNRLRGIGIEGAKKPKDQSLSQAGFHKFMHTAQGILSKYDMTMLYLLTLGERRSEALGLQFRSFRKGHDDIGDYYRIHFYVGRTLAEPNGGKLKTESSEREIYVRGGIVVYIDDMLQHSKDICAKTHRVCNENTFVYLDERTGMPPHPGRVNIRIFKKVSKASGVEVRPHMLRHYFATQALEKGLPDMSVMHWLGHKNITMTNEYTRPTAEGAQQVFRVMQGGLLDDSNDSSTKSGTNPVQHRSNADG